MQAIKDVYRSLIGIYTYEYQAECIGTDNTVQDEPAWSISTTRGFPTSEITAFDAEREAEQEYLTLSRNT